MQYTLLKDISGESIQATVKVRVVRFCETFNNENPPQPRWIDLVLLDEEGKAMAGQIPEKCIQKFKAQLKEDSIYYIRFFQVCNVWTNFRPVDHPYMMRFTAHTTIFDVNPVPQPFPIYACTLVGFDVLRTTRLNKTEYTSDTLGILTGCSHVKMQSTRNGLRKLRNVSIVDERHQRATVALWGQQADAFDADSYMEMAAKGIVIILFVGVTSKLFDGDLSLQGSTVCRFYINPDLPEAIALQNSTLGCIKSPTWYGPTASHSAPIPITVSELAKYDNPHLIYSNRYLVTVSIKSIAPNQSWWYLACTVPNCNRSVKLEPAGDAYRCTNPTCSGTNGAPRYRLPLLVTDPTKDKDRADTPTIEIVLFGPRAEEIIGCPVDSLTGTGATHGRFISTRITSMYGKQLQLRVSVSLMSLQRTEVTYQVDAIVGVPTAPLHTVRSDDINKEHQATATLPQATQSTGSTSGGPDNEQITPVQDSQQVPPESVKGTANMDQHFEPLVLNTPAQVQDTEKRVAGQKRFPHEPIGDPAEDSTRSTYRAEESQARRRLDLTE